MTPTTAQSLYRTWRSRTFEEVVGQGHITQTLRNAVRHNSVGHAYLLTGPRGTGKTSTARILARAVNCLQPRDGEPCNECAPCRGILANHCMDVVEIDAASKSRVDEMRDVIDKVGYAPTEARRKVYIVDEVHMLSSHAFNALLKTIEEPPAHVIFCLATTDVHKVPATITSRCQRLDFRTIAPDDIVERLAYVCEREGMQAERAALELIAQQATGSLRDALSLLEQVRAYEDAHIGVAEVEDALGLARRETLARLTDCIVAGDAGRALALIGDLAASGADMRQYAKQLVQYWRDLLLLRVGSVGPRPAAAQDPAMAAQAARLSPADITAVLKAILQPDYSGRRSASPALQLELAVAEAATRFTAGTVDPARSVPVMEAPSLNHISHVPTNPIASGSGKAPVSDELDHNEAPLSEGDQEQAAPRPSRAKRTPSVSEPDDPSSRAMPPEPEATHGSPRESSSKMRVAEVTAVGNQSSEMRDPEEIWTRVQQHLSSEGKGNLNQYLKACHPVGLEGDQFVLGFAPSSSSWVRNQVETPNRRAALERALTHVLGRVTTLRCDTLRQQPQAAGAAEQRPDDFVREAERRLRAIHVER